MSSVRAATSALMLACTAGCLDLPGSERSVAVAVGAAHSSAADRITLGKALFFDPLLSASGTLACATCHHPELGFADGLRVARGNHGQPLERHTPALVNVGSMMRPRGVSNAKAAKVA